jgi:hypothetical protein
MSVFIPKTRTTNTDGGGEGVSLSYLESNYTTYEELNTLLNTALLPKYQGYYDPATQYEKSQYVSQTPSGAGATLPRLYEDRTTPTLGLAPALDDTAWTTLLQDLGPTFAYKA